MALKYSVERIDSNVHYFKFSLNSSETVPTLFCSDIHLDSINCKREILKKHFDEIKRNDGLIFIFGDLFDVMATYGDKRLQREDIDPQFIQRERTYLDLIREFAIEFLKPYAENIVFISEGNHETTIKKFHNTDVLRGVIYALNLDPKVNIAYGDYSGWINLRFQTTKTHSKSLNVHYHHGFGGSAKRSKGMLDVQLEVMKYPDADILVRGHTHQKWYDPSTTRVRLTRKGRIYKDKCRYIQSGSYIDGIGEGKGGWAVQRNFMPTDIGGWYVNFTPVNHKGNMRIDVGVHETPVDTF